MALQRKADPEAYKRLQEKVAKNKQAKKDNTATTTTTKTTQTTTPTTNKTESSTTTRTAPKVDQTAYKKLQEKVARQKSESNKQPTKTTTTTTKPTDYSSAVKYLKDRGVNGAGIMTSGEWSRRAKSGNYGNTYQDYLDSMVNKYYPKSATTRFVKHDADYWEKRYMEETERIKNEHPNDPMFPAGAHATAIVDEEMKREEYLLKYQDKKYDDNFFGQFAASFRAGDIAEEMSKAKVDYYKTGNKADLEYIQQLGVLAEKLQFNNREVFADDATLPEVSQDFAGYLPQFINRQVPQKAGGLIGAAAGGLVGGLVTAEGGGFGAVPGAKLGYKAGEVAVSGYNSYDTMKADAYYRFIELGADEETARAAANDEAVLGAITEMGDTWLSLGKLGYQGAINLIGKDATKKTAKSGLKKLAKLLGQYGFNIEQERIEEGVQGAVSVANERRVYNEMTRKADAEIGQYGKGNIDLYNRPQYKYPSGVTATVESALFGIDDELVLLPTIAFDKNGNAIKLTNDEAIQRYIETGEHLGKFKTEEEANEYAQKLHLAQDYYYSDQKDEYNEDGMWGLTKDAGKVLVGVDFGTEDDATIEEINEQKRMGGTIAAVMGIPGTAFDVAATSYVEGHNAYARKTIDTAIASGLETKTESEAHKKAEALKAKRDAGETITKAELVDVVITTTREKSASDPTTLEEAARGAVENRQRKNPAQMLDSLKRGEMTAEILDALTKDNVQITAEEVKKVTGLGDKGSELIAKLANQEGRTFSQAEQAVKTAYNAGFTNLETSKVSFNNALQKEAFDAGKIDRGVDDRLAIAKAQKAVIHDGGIVENEFASNLNREQRRTWEKLAKPLGLRMQYVDKLLASKTYDENGNEVKHYANAQYTGGEVTRALDSGREFIEDTIEEVFHRMEELNTPELNVLRDALYHHAEQFGINYKLDARQPTLRFDEEKALHDEAGIRLNTLGYVGEVSASEIGILFENEEAFNSWHDKVMTDPQLKSGWQKFVEFFNELVEKVRTLIHTAKMSKEDRATYKAKLESIEHLRDLLADTLRASEKVVTEKRNEMQSKSADTKSTKNLDIKINQEYNGSASYSMKAQRGRSIELETMENNRFERLRRFHGDLPAQWFAFTDGYFYIYSNQSYMDYTILLKVRLTERNKQDIINFTEEIINGIDGGSKTLNNWFASFRRGKGRNSWHSISPIKTRATRRVDGVDVRPSRSDNSTDIKRSGKHSESEITRYSLKKNAPTFYSYMGKTIDGMKQEKIGASSVVSYLTGRGVKAEEIKWSGIETFLEGKKSVTKAELQEFVAGNQLQIETKSVKDDITISYTQNELDELDTISKELEDAWFEANDIWNEAYGTDIPFDILGSDDTVSAMIRYVIGQHGGIRNFEGVSHLSDSERKIYDDYGTNSITRKIKDLEERQADIAERARARRDNTKQTKYHKYTLDGGSGNYRELLFKLPNSEYTNDAMSMHWGEGGILAHARVQDFDVAGQKMLFIEEIQSDWHNEGAKKGYVTDNKKLKEQLETLKKKNSTERNGLSEALANHFKGKAPIPTVEATNFINSMNDDLGFQNFLIKKYDIPAELVERAKAYHKSKTEELEIWQQSISAKRGVEDAPFRNNYHEYVLKNLLRMAAEEGYDSIGWTTADIQSERWSDKYAEGYRIEYDQDIPKFLNKYGKKWGAKVGREWLTINEDMDEVNVWSMPITDSMKDSVLHEGQPMFSLKKPVEETKDLVAVHNTTAEKLIEAVKLGGLPSPSIAITKKDVSHEKFGDISLVFRKATISPTDRRNKIYSGDAYTPTGVRVEYDVDDDILQSFNKRLKKLTPEWSSERLPSVDSGTADAENDSLYKAYERNDRAKLAFLREKGKAPKVAMRTPSLSTFVSNDTVIALAKAFSAKQLSDIANTSDGVKQYKNAFLKVIRDTEDSRAVETGIYSVDAVHPFDIAETARVAKSVKENKYKIKKEVDNRKTYEMIDKKFTKTLKAEYRAWIDENTKDAIIDKGIRNNRDLFTPSGNRRSFKQLHEPYNLSNIIKQMFSGDDKGIALFGGSPIGAAQHEYSSIDEVKADSGRLQQLEQEEYDNIRNQIEGDVFELASKMQIRSDVFTVRDLLSEAIGKKTKQQADSYLKRESQGWAKYSPEFTNELWDIRERILNMPTEYFEAKPQRAVNFNEVALAVLPKGMTELRRMLEDAGVQKVVYYDKGKDGDRLAKVNSVPDGRFSLKRETDITSKDTKDLIDIIEHLKGEFEVTKFAKADPKKLAKMTKDILKEYSSQASYDETFKAIDELYQYLANGEDGHAPIWDDVYSRAYNTAYEIIKNAVVVDDYSYREYKSLRDYLRNTPMKFDTRYDSVPTYYDGFQDFYRRNFGRLNFKKDGASIDSVYQELAGLYPEFFDAEEQINSADQLERIVDVLDSLKPSEVNPYSGETKQIASYLANDLIDRFFDIPQAKPTFADKAERRVVQERIKGGRKVEAVRQQKEEKIKKLIEAQREKTKKQLDKLREQRDTKVKKEQEKRRTAISKMSESQKAKVLRARIIRHTTELHTKLTKGTDNNHIPKDLQGLVLALLENINLESSFEYAFGTDGLYHRVKPGTVLGAEPTKRTETVAALQKLYKNMEGSITIDPDLLGEDGLLSDVIALSSKRIADMTSAELETVWQTIRAIEASVSTANKVFSQGKFETILGFAEALRDDNSGKKEKTELKGLLGKTKNLATLNMLTPETYLHYLGSAGDSIFRMMRNAQDKHISIMKEVADFTHKTLKGVKVNSLEKTLHNVRLGGQNVKLSTAQLMELYVLMKREQAIDHIMVGGILPDITEGKGMKLNTKAEPIRNLTMTEINDALSNLTDEQKKIADKLQKFVSTVLSEYGNEASMKVYNYEKFLEKNYWTIRTNKQEIVSEIGKDNTVTSVANKGMAKGTKPHANTSVRIGSIFDTFSAHSSDMATYAAWLGTSEDVNRIRNFVFWEDGARKGTVKGILDTVHGTHGSDYLQKLLTDIAIGVKGTDNMNPFDKFIGNYKAASVGANLRVVIQQPTAILRAMDMINPIYIAEGAVRPLKGWEKAKKYAPIAQWKDWGYFDINTGRQMKDVLFENASLLEKTKQAGMWGASMADSLAWGQLWNAVEAETKAKHKDLEVGTDEYYETVAKRFTEVVDHTQVVDGILQRSQIMRSADGLTKMATSFMGEPTKQYNMAISAAYDAMNTKGNARKNACARLGRTAMALAVAGIINACAQSFIDALRDDDKEKDYWEKWLAAFGGNSLDTVNPFNYVPFAKDIISIMQGYDVKRMDAEAISKAIGAITNMHKAVTGTGKYTIAEASAQLFAEVARLYGVPVANVKRDIKSLVTSVAIESDSYLMQYRMEKAMLDINYAGNNKNFMDILFNAYNNDREAYEYIYKDMLASGYEEDKIQSGMETRMKKAEGVEKASELSKRYMTPDVETKYDSSLNKIKSNRVWQSATSTQRKGAEADLYNFLTSTTDDMEKTRAEARMYGVDETEYTLWKLAIEMADQPKGQKGSGSYDYKEKAEAINSLNLGDRETVYFFGKGLNETSKQELTETLDAGIDIQEYVNFKAATSDMKADKYANGKSVPNSKKRKVVNYLNSADLTAEEWNYFYYEIMNYKK